VAIDCTSKFAYAGLHQEAGKMVAAQFLRVTDLVEDAVGNRVVAE